MTTFIGGDQTLTGDERVKLDLASYRGDTNKPIIFSGVGIATALNPIVDVAIALTKDRIERTRLATANGSITINSFGSFTLNQYVMDLPCYVYKYDVQIILNDGTKLTPIYGSWKIIEDQTKP